LLVKGGFNPAYAVTEAIVAHDMGQPVAGVTPLDVAIRGHL
jgi:hypothetical protein